MFRGRVWKIQKPSSLSRFPHFLDKCSFGGSSIGKNDTFCCEMFGDYFFLFIFFLLGRVQLYGKNWLEASNEKITSHRVLQKVWMITVWKARFRIRGQNEFSIRSSYECSTRKPENVRGFSHFVYQAKICQRM